MNRGTGGRRALRRTAPAVGAVALALGALAGCGSTGTHSDALPPAPHPSTRHTPAGQAAGHTVVYRITGRGTASSIVYLSDGASAKVTERNVRLPWSRTLTLSGRGERAASLVVTFAELGGATHDDSITVDGDVLTHGTVAGTGAAHSDLSGTFGG